METMLGALGFLCIMRESCTPLFACFCWRERCSMLQLRAKLLLPI